MNEEKLKQEIEAYLNENFCDKDSYCIFVGECKEGTRMRCSEFELLTEHIFNFVVPREKENAELKEQHKTDLIQIQAILNQRSIQNKKFIKAKELLRFWINDFYDGFNSSIRYEERRKALEQSEQFLSEVDK